MLQILKKSLMFNSICLTLALFQTSIIYNSDSLATSDRTHEFFEELNNNEVDHDKLIDLIKEGIDLTDTRQNETPLIKAVKKLKDNSNGQSVIKALIDASLTKNEPALYAQDRYGNTPLSIAAQLRKHEFYNALYRVYTYEQQEIVNKKGMHAIEYKNLVDRTDKFFHYLRNRLTTIDPRLHDDLLHLIQRGIQFNYHKGFLQETPLTIAVKSLPDDAMGKEIVENLLKEGAYYDSTNFAGSSALSIAIQNKKPEFAKLLLSYGANPNMQDSDGKSAKDYAQESTDEAIQNFFSRRKKDKTKKPSVLALEDRKQQPQQENTTASEPRIELSDEDMINTKGKTQKNPILAIEDRKQQPQQENTTPSEPRIELSDADMINAIKYFNFNPDNLTRSDLVKLRADYRKSVIKLHPDHNKASNAKEKFQEFQAHYETLIPLLKKYKIIS